MRLVDKYELAKCPYGTPFYYLSLCADGFFKYYQIESGLQILTSNTLYSHTGNKPMFNGVCSLQPDIYDEINCCGVFTEDMVEKASFELYEDDDDSNNYDDEDRFLVLDKSEFKILLDELQNYYNQIIEK